MYRFRTITQCITTTPPPPVNRPCVLFWWRRFLKKHFLVEGLPGCPSAVVLSPLPAKHLWKRSWLSTGALTLFAWHQGGVPCAVRALCEKLAVLHHREFGKFRRLEGCH